ncbi:FIST N-terminal domain-containing protein [Algoriphagus sp.]|uniref:FIST signal transduction protein n=1 Tax=Algoriphagus sp. TaxID=1872435 RepID=UPI00261FF107|nr:FIST N-terminal domain-containing protein [Algoriphagus sp.]
MKAKNISGESIDQIKQRFAEATSDGFAPTLAILFCSISQDRAALRDFFKSRDIALVGATSAGEIINDEVLEQSAVILLLDIKKEHFALFFEESSDTLSLAEKLSKFSKATFQNPSVIVISSGLTIDAENIINGFHSFDPSIPLFGGLAADDLTMTSTYVFTNEKESSNGLIGLVIDGDKINIKGLATSGWDNIGIEKTITKSEGNVVYTIDDEPAVDVFVNYFQFTESVDNKAEIIATNFAQYPLQMKKDNGNTVLRAPLMVDIDSRALIFAGGIPQGSKVKFSVQPGFDLIEKTADKISLLKPTIPEADALIMFSCKARHMALGPLTGDEAGMIQAIWDKPLIGFFTYGEIGATENSTCDFHNETCSMVILKEIDA